MVYTNNGRYLSLRKEGNSAIFDNMGEHWEHFNKWNEPVTERQILQRLHLYEVSKIVKSIESKR